MKNNKLFSILLALLVCLSMVVSASATSESDLVFTLESNSSVELLDSAVVNPGEEFTVQVNIAKNPGFVYAMLQVEFDAEKLELVSAESKADKVTLAKSNSVGLQSIQIGSFSLPFSKDAITATGTVAELTFKVLEETDVKTAVTLNADQKRIVDVNGKSSAISVAGDVLNVNVVAADHVCDATKTVEADNAEEADCINAGKATDLLCAHCGKLVAEGEVIAALGHTNGDAVIENSTDATCVADGKYDTVIYCTVCKAEVSRETTTVPALGHTNGSAVVENSVNATCEADGKYDTVIYCTVCKAEVSRETTTVAATGHAWDDGKITTEPGCSTMGVRTYTCGNCAATKLDEHVPATGAHTYGDWTVKTAATTEAEGVEARVCSQCGAEETRSIAKLPEPPVAPKNNTLMIVIIVVAVLAGAGVAAFFVLKNKKK